MRDLLVLYFSESHSLVVVWWDRKKPGIVATKTRCLVPPTLKSPIDEGLPYRHRGMCSQKQKTKKVFDFTSHLVSPGSASKLSFDIDRALVNFNVH